MNSHYWRSAALAATMFVLSPVIARDLEVEQALLEMSKEINKTLPVKIDREKVLETTVAIRSTLIYKYKFVDETTIRNPRFDRKLYEKHLAQSLRGSTCPDRGVAELLRRGARFNYLFIDKYGTTIVDFTLDQTACSSP